MKTTYGYFEPRIGIAFQPRSLPNTSFRAGFGLFTAPLSYSTYNHTADIAPVQPHLHDLRQLLERLLPDLFRRPLR